MKKLAIALLALGVAGALVAYRNEPDGFRGLKWGDPVPAGWTQSGTDPSYGGILIYQRPGEDLSLGAASFSSIGYGFWHGRFSGVTCKFSGSTNFHGVLSACTEKFGAPSQPNEFMDRYYWIGAATVVSVDYNDIGNEGFLMLDSHKLLNEMVEWEKAKAKSGAENGF